MDFSEWYDNTLSQSGGAGDVPAPPDSSPPMGLGLNSQSAIADLMKQRDDLMSPPQREERGGMGGMGSMLLMLPLMLAASHGGGGGTKDWLTGRTFGGRGNGNAMAAFASVMNAGRQREMQEQAFAERSRMERARMIQGQIEEQVGLGRQLLMGVLRQKPDMLTNPAFRQALATGDAESFFGTNPDLSTPPDPQQQLGALLAEKKLAAAQAALGGQDLSGSPVAQTLAQSMGLLPESPQAAGWDAYKVVGRHVLGLGPDGRPRIVESIPRDMPMGGGRGGGKTYFKDIPFEDGVHRCLVDASGEIVRDYGVIKAKVTDPLQELLNAPPPAPASKGPGILDRIKGFFSGDDPEEVARMIKGGP